MQITKTTVGFFLGGGWGVVGWVVSFHPGKGVRVVEAAFRDATRTAVLKAPGGAGKLGGGKFIADPVEGNRGEKRRCGGINVCLP